LVLFDQLHYSKQKRIQSRSTAYIAYAYTASHKNKISIAIAISWWSK